MPQKPLLAYDEGCPFCKYWVVYWNSITGDAVDYQPFQEIANSFPQIKKEEFEKSIKLILPTGEVFSGAHATFKTLSYGGNSWPLFMYKYFPGFAFCSEFFYRFVASQRSMLFPLTRFLWGKTLTMPSYKIVTWLFLRLLGLIYFIAFFSFFIQLNGLIGSTGILPVSSYLDRVHEVLGIKGYWFVPTIFWLTSADQFLNLINLAGVILSLFLLFGIFQRVALVLLFIFYLSLTSVGQVFMHFQWDSLLLEAGFLAIFLGWSETIIFLFRWLLFRFVFMSGAVKFLSGDLTWRDFTALNYHFETQPLPTVFAWYAHQLPELVKKSFAGGMFFIELFVPFLIFAPRMLRFYAAFLIIFLEITILLTGNYNFLNLFTIFLCLFLTDDRLVSRFLPNWLKREVKSTAFIQPFFIALTIFILILSTTVMFGRFTGKIIPPLDSIANFISPFRIINPYGVFAIMTKVRNEIIIEGSTDGNTWFAYELKHKPGELSRIPTWVAPHQPRLDWQMWFASLSSYNQNPWFINFVTRLLQGSPEVLSLLEKNPFSTSPPRYIRVLFYEYHFTSFDEKLIYRNWWKRELKGLYMPIASLSATKR